MFSQENRCYPTTYRRAAKGYLIQRAGGCQNLWEGHRTKTRESCHQLEDFRESRSHRKLPPIISGHLERQNEWSRRIYTNTASKKTSLLLPADAHSSSFIARPTVTLDQLLHMRVKAFCWLLILESSINSMYNHPHHSSSHIYTCQIDEVNEDLSWINVHSYLGLSWWY